MGLERCKALVFDDFRQFHGLCLSRLFHLVSLVRLEGAEMAERQGLQWAGQRRLFFSQSIR